METCLNLSRQPNDTTKNPKLNPANCLKNDPESHANPSVDEELRYSQVNPILVRSRMPDCGTCGILPPSSLPLTGLTGFVGRLGRGFALSRTGSLHAG